jgi:hypothetical protein
MSRRLTASLGYLPADFLRGRGTVLPLDYSLDLIQRVPVFWDCPLGV